MKQFTIVFQSFDYVILSYDRNKLITFKMIQLYNTYLLIL